MKSQIGNLVMFAIGAAVGSAVTFMLVKTTYERRTDAELESMKKYYEGKEAEKEPEPKKEKNVKPLEARDPVLLDYAKKIKECGYIRDFEEGGPVEMNKPYVITPEEFSDSDYNSISLTYYADGILTDEDDEIIDDIDEIVGIESLKHFGEYEDDSVFVRNDEKHCDYEILLDERKYYPDRPGSSRVDE